MALTLIEAAKLESGDVYKQGVIEQFAQSSEIMRVLPFENISGNALKYNVEGALPGIGFRGVNGSFTESTGVLNPKTESLVIAGGDLDVDKFIVDTQGGAVRSTHEAMKIKALALAWTKTFYKGDSEANPKEFDGLQKRIVGDQLIENHATGAGLSLAKLDEMIDAVENPTHLTMSKAMRRILTVAARTQAVGGNITYTKDEFGRQITMYNDLPIIIVGKDNVNSKILDFNEAGLTTSIYCLSLEPGRFEGIENGGIDVRDLGELESKSSFRTRVEWYNAFAIYDPMSVGRLSKITNAAATA